MDQKTKTTLTTALKVIGLFALAWALVMTGSLADEHDDTAVIICDPDCALAIEAGPPVEPPPEPEPTPPDYAVVCAQPDTLCNSFGSEAAVVGAAVEGTANGGSPNYPAKNGKCQWNAAEGTWGGRACFPIYIEGDCSDMDARIADPGQSQATFVQASLWSSCYDPDMDAVRLDYWNDIGSSMHRLYAVDNDQNRTFTDRVWMRFEIAFDDEMWHTPLSGSSTSKLTRLNRLASDGCTDKRGFDHRFSFSPDSVRLGFAGYCGGGQPPTGDWVALPPGYAGVWVRVTTELDLVAGVARMWVDRLDDTPVGYIEAEYPVMDLTATSWDILVHSTGRRVDDLRSEPQLWMRNFAISADPIAR